MTITTDYTCRANPNTLCGAPLTRYRFAHWLCDIVRNFMSNPEHVRDERLRGLLWPQDGIEDDACRASFQVGLPLSQDSRKACVTPAIMVSAGQQEYPAEFINVGIQAEETVTGIGAMYERTAIRQVAGKIAIVTESLDGTLLLCDVLEDFFITGAPLMQSDGMVQKLTLGGSSEPAMVRVGEAGNAKELFQSVIAVTAVGGITWVTDTQGPVYRGITETAAMT